MSPPPPTAEPIVKWMGGKSRLAPTLLALFPPHRCYVEVFCGGAALYFRRSIPAKVSVLNDIHGKLMNLYRVVQRHPQALIQQLKQHPTSRQLFEQYRMTPPEILTDIERAARFCYLQNHAFGARLHRPSFGTGTTRSVLNIPRLLRKLAAAHHRLAKHRTCIESLSWRECIKRYDRPHTFFYLDPPYWQLSGYEEEKPLKFEDYAHMAQIMQHCQGKVLLSINDHSDIRALFQSEKFTVYPLETRYTLDKPQEGQRKKSQELAITNWEKESPS